MANTVTATQLFPAASTKSPMVLVHLTGLMDGSGDEAGVKKVDITTLLNAFGVQPNQLSIESVRWSIQQINYVLLQWDRTAAAITAMVLAQGSGFEDFTLEGFKIGGMGGAKDFLKLGGKQDPSAGNADAKGSILLTTNGSVANASYDITLLLRCGANPT